MKLMLNEIKDLEILLGSIRRRITEGNYNIDNGDFISEGNVGIFLYKDHIEIVKNSEA